MFYESVLVNYIR